MKNINTYIGEKFYDNISTPNDLKVNKIFDKYIKYLKELNKKGIEIKTVHPSYNKYIYIFDPNIKELNELNKIINEFPIHTIIFYKTGDPWTSWACEKTTDRMWESVDPDTGRRGSTYGVEDGAALTERIFNSYIKRDSNKKIECRYNENYQ